jgi:SNF2-related domain
MFPGFSLAARNADVQRLHIWNVCSCPNYPDVRIRVPDCSCYTETGVSPLLQVRWKRLVLDEGHVSATIATSLTPFAKLLSVERRWIVTGTPTTNLLGLGFGQSGAEGLNNDADIFGDWLDSNGSTQAASDANDTNSRLVARKWTKYDREDLRKLATMIIHFLAVPSFATDPQAFDRYVIAPLFHDGPSIGAIRVLEQVMNTVMIRHR